MKKWLCTIMILCMIFSMAINSFASDKMTTAYKGTPVIDGDIDSIWEYAERIEATNFKTGIAGSAGPCKLFARTLWDDGHLYMLFEVTDPVVTVVSATAWNQDSIEFYVDEDNSKSGANDGINDAQVRINAENFSDWAADRVISAVKKSDTGYIVEVEYIFIDVMPKATGVIGFDIQVNDDADNSGERAACLGWSDDADKASSDTNVWGNLTFSPDAPPAPAPEIIDEAADNPPTADADNMLYILSIISGFGFVLILKRKFSV
ncbi:MAG: endo,4-beta-xylanase [Clostridia bacterium]|nr:endo,4-beta-xylanase [Clostridia bacterium]